MEWPSWSSEKRMINKSNVLKLVIRNKFMQVWIYMNSQNVFNCYKNEKVTPYEHDKTKSNQTTSYNKTGQESS